MVVVYNYFEPIPDPENNLLNLLNQSRFQTLKMQKSSPESAKHKQNMSKQNMSKPKRIEKGKTSIV